MPGLSGTTLRVPLGVRGGRPEGHIKGDPTPSPDCGLHIDLGANGRSSTTKGIVMLEHTKHGSGGVDKDDLSYKLFAAASSARLSKREFRSLLRMRALLLILEMDVDTQPLPLLVAQVG